MRRLNNACSYNHSFQLVVSLLVPGFVLTPPSAAEGLPVDTLNAWQKALLWVSAIIFVGSYTALGFLFHYFGGCSTNSAFLCMTLILTLVATVLQCSGEVSKLIQSITLLLHSF